MAKGLTRHLRSWGSRVPSRSCTGEQLAGTVYYLDDKECAKKYGRVWGGYELVKPVLAVMDPDMLKTILVKECLTHFTNRRNFLLNGELYDAVNLAEDYQWRRLRNILSPNFTSGRIKEMFSIMKHHSHKLTTCLQSKARNNEVITMKDFFGAYTIDVMASCVFSVDMDSISNPSSPSPFITHLSKLFRFSLIPFMFAAWFPIFLPILELLGVSLFPRSTTTFFKALVEKVRAERNGSSQQNSRDFLQNMIDYQTASGPENQTQNKGLTDHEIISQVTMLVFAGYETSSTTLTLLAYSLARNPEVMKRLQAEIDSTFPNKGPIQYEALMQMEYLDSVVSEGLRFYPPAGRLERIAKQTVKVNGVTIPKNMLVMIPVYALHHDPELWPEPEEFKPDRFSKQNKQNINQYTYLPFGLGPRNCIGMRFALVMVKLALVEVLQNYSFSVCEETEIPLTMDPQGSVGPKNPIKLKLVTRSVECN
ncbi:cytochrome P450 3A30-like isoform X2 [Acanthopagrus latus]|uniref:cytochrome P450 3A30-like isoform X2 n=1 Tax=Acanthopagrus latus TaxID=8177 RepID=UPI00187C5B01|nr:cytochrome P450 3A30-like isoform X2 [Acanthopagrus latus]XP_036968068.1 cytochrome P450 3A30-like isoform X2 [Acanthopagrus latus]